MPLSVDWTSLERRRDQWGRLREGDEAEWMVELWIVLDGVSGPPAESLVGHAADIAWGDPPGSRWAVTASSEGVYVARGTGDWRGTIIALVGALDAASGRVTVPPATPADPASGRVVAQAFLAFSMDSSPSAGPFNANGTLKLRWGVGPEVTQRIVEEAVAWTAVAGDIGRIGPILPTTPADAARALQQTLWPGNYQHRMLFAADLAATRARAVTFAEFGLTSWTEVRPKTSLADDARAVTERLTEYAQLVDYAHVGPGTSTLRVDRDRATQDVWRSSRPLWSTFVPAPYSAQLMTSAQLERTNDLSRWTVERVTSNRWLVTAGDFDAWWDIPDLSAFRSLRAPDPDLLAKAVADFGDAILSRYSIDR